MKHVVVNGPADTSVLDGLDLAVHAWEDLIRDQPETFDWVEGDEHDAAAMCYTSGTTGNPKGVVYSHRSIYLHSMQVCMGDGVHAQRPRPVLAVVPHVPRDGVGAALCGADGRRLDDHARPLPHARAAGGASSRPRSPPWPVRCRRSGRACSPSSTKHEPDRRLLAARRRRRRLGLPAGADEGVRGPARRAHHPRLGDDRDLTAGLGGAAAGGVEGEAAWAYRVTQGRLVASVQGRLVAPDGSLAAARREAVGEIEIRGPWTPASYYHGRRPDKFHDGWLRTGDVGSITPDGFLSLTDRSKDVIKSGGEWISSVELENALMAHPASSRPRRRRARREVGRAAAGHRRVREGEKVEVDELRDFLADGSPWQLPERWAFIDEVPKTSVGKFDKKVLRQRYAEGELSVQTTVGPGVPLAARP